MARKSTIYILGLVLVFTFALAGCGADTGIQEIKIESGAINQEYNGILKPVVPKEFKLTEQDKQEGIKKVTLKKTQDVTPGDSITKAATGNENVQQSAGGDQVAKPKI